MKQLLLFLVLCFVSKLSAQITVTNAIFPQAGDLLVTSVSNNTAFSPTAASGTAQNWDFSMLTTDFLNTDSVEAASTGTAFSSFPNTTILESILELGTAYTKVDSQAMTRLGAGIELGLPGLSFVAVYTDPHIIQTANLTYNTSHNDLFEINFSDHIDSIPFLRNLIDSLNPISIASPDSIRVRVEGTHNMLVDAFGNCTIYSGSYDVLRQKVETRTNIYVDIYVTISFGLGSWIDITNQISDVAPFPTQDTTIYYDFIAEGIKEPIVRMNMTADGNNVASMEFRGENNPSAVLNIKTPPTLTIFPNPTKDAFHFDSNVLGVDNFNLQIFDLQGKLIQEQSYSKKGIQEVGLHHLTTGTYQIRFVSEEGKTLGLSPLVIQP